MWGEWETKKTIDLPRNWSVAVGHSHDGWWSVICDGDGKHIDGRQLGKSERGVMVEALEIVREYMTDERDALNDGVEQIERIIKETSNARAAE